MFPAASAPDDAALGVTFAGLTLPNPVGIAAGFDKDARVPDAILQLGCGFAEIGTVTPVPQLGNPSPARVPAAARPRHHQPARLQQRRSCTRHSRGCSAARGRGVVGVNIGANKDSADRIADYVRGMETFYDVASYFTINISSPNTPGLRDLQDPAALEASAAAPARRARQTDRRPASRGVRSSSSWRPTSPSSAFGAIVMQLAAQRRRRHRRLEHDAVARRPRRCRARARPAASPGARCSIAPP